MTRDEQVHSKAITTIALVGTLVSVACLLVGAYMEAFYMAGASVLYILRRGSTKR